MAKLLERLDMMSLAEKSLRCHEDYVAVKLFQNGKIKETFSVPSAMYPLNGSPRIFTNRNTQTATQAMLDVFDKTSYRIGHCYQNSDILDKNLRAAEIESEIYVGWYFPDFEDAPIHHAWVVAGGTVLDLSNQMGLLYINKDRFIGENIREYRERMLDFQSWAMTLKNSERCMPVGIVAEGSAYIGSPCSAEDGIRIFNTLCKCYPNHPCLSAGTDAEGYSPMQQLYKKRGLI